MCVPQNISSIRERCNNTPPRKVACPISPTEIGNLPQNRTSDFSRTALLPLHGLTAALLFCLAPASWNQTRRNCGGRRHCLSDEMGEGKNQPLTMTTFQSRSRTFFMGKWGARPLQNLVTIEKSRRAKGSWLCVEKPGRCGERQVRKWRWSCWNPVPVTLLLDTQRKALTSSQRIWELGS